MNTWALALGMFSACTAAACDCGSRRPSLIYSLDSETRGWVVVVYDQPGTPALTRVRGDAYSLAVPTSGVLLTSTKPPFGVAQDEFRVRGRDGSEQPLPRDRVRAQRTGWTQKAQGKTMQYEVFFVGNAEELETAAPDEQVIARVYATLR